MAYRNENPTAMVIIVTMTAVDRVLFCSSRTGIVLADEIKIAKLSIDHIVEITTVIVTGITGIGNGDGSGGIIPCGSDGLGPPATVGTGGNVLVGYGVAIGLGVWVGTGVAPTNISIKTDSKISLVVLLPITALSTQLTPRPT